jgi:hypothetical protein
VNAREFVAKYGITGGAVGVDGNGDSYLFFTTAHDMKFGFNAIVNHHTFEKVPTLTSTGFIQLKAAQVTQNPSLAPWAGVVTWDLRCTAEDIDDLRRWMGSEAMWADFLSITSP